MAENTNTGPSLNPSMGSSQMQKELREARDVTKEIKKEAGDYRDILRDSIRELNATLRSYDKIQAKLASINKETINIKEVEAQIRKAKEASFLNEKKLADLNASISEKGKESARKFNESLALQVKLEKDILANKNLGFAGLAKKQQAQLDQLNTYIERQKQDLTVDQVAYANSLKQKELDDEILALSQKQLESEKQIAQNIGVTGFLAQKFADKLGVGETFYKNMVLKAREANRELTLGEKSTLIWRSATEQLKKSWDDFKKDPAMIAAGVVSLYKAAEAGLTKMGNVARNAANGLGDFMSMTGDQVIGKMTSAVSGLVSKIPFVGGLLGGLVDAFGKILELSLAEDDKLVKIGRQLGVSRGEAQKIQVEFERIANNSGNALISGRALLESQKELSNELGVNNVLSGQILKTNIELGKLAGLDVKTRGAIAQSSIITGRSSESITKSVLGQVGALKAATGVSFNYQKVLSEASNLSGVLGLQFAKYPDKLTKALVSTKAMGLELSKLNAMGDSFLDFESSITKEFEAQLLTGKNINLSKAREAFLNNDLATAAKEITRQVGSSEQFLKMNRIQQESLAQAMGMSKEEMADMLRQQEMFSKLGAKDLKEAQAKVEALKAQGKSREEIAKIVGEEAYQNMTNASAQEKIAGFLDKIQSAVATFLAQSPIVDVVNSAIEFLSKPDSMAAIVAKLQGFFAFIFDAIGGLTAGLMKAANWFLTGADEIDEGLIQKVESGGDFIRKMKLTGGSNEESKEGGTGAAPKKEEMTFAGDLYSSPQSGRVLSVPNEGRYMLSNRDAVLSAPLEQFVGAIKSISDSAMRRETPAPMYIPMPSAPTQPMTQDRQPLIVNVKTQVVDTATQMQDRAMKGIYNEITRMS